VDLGQARQEKLSSYVETVGFLDAEGQTDIAAGVPGVVEEVLFREGDWVIEDQTILCRIEPRKYGAMLAQAQANVKRAQAAVKRAQASARKAEAACKDAQETLELRKVVLDNIRRSGRAAKVEERQEAQANVEVGQARVGVAKADVEVAGAELEAARKDVDAAQALFEVAEHNWRRSQVRAPYTGQINQRKVTRGSYLEEKTVIATMADLSRLRLVGYIPEKSAPIARHMLEQENRLRTAFLAGPAFTAARAGPWAALAAVLTDRAGDTPAVFPLEFELRTFPNRSFKGRIFYLSTVASPDTHMFECKAEVPARDKAELRPGYTAKIRCPLPGRSSSIVIPEEAVRASERGFIAFRPRPIRGPDGETEYIAEAVTLELGARRPGSVEVLKGLRPGDWVVQKGAESLEEGTPLNISRQQSALLNSGR
jgi:multidrug efflux system membrane fusion protein